MTSISKNIDKFLEIVKQYNSTAHNKIKMKSVDAKPETFIDLKLIQKGLNLRLVIMYKFQDTKTHFQKVIPNWSKEVFVIKKIKDTTLWTYVIEDLNSFHATGFFL